MLDLQLLVVLNVGPGDSTSCLDVTCQYMPLVSYDQAPFRQVVERLETSNVSLVRRQWLNALYHPRCFDIDVGTFQHLSP